MVVTTSLQIIPFFAEFAPNELDGIAALMIERAYQPGEVIFSERQPSPGLFFVARGRVRVFKTSPRGREQTLCLMTPRTCFGGCPIFDGDLSPVTAQALESATVYILPRSAAIAGAKNDPAAAKALMRVFGSRMNQLAGIAEGLTFKCATQRLAEVLLAHADERGRPTAQGIEIELDLTQEKLASLVGCAREVVTRSLLRLERLGAIEARGRRILIQDRDKLARAEMGRANWAAGAHATSRPTRP
jgi:CRP/FNR family transcriptional regulator